MSEDTTQQSFHEVTETPLARRRSLARASVWLVSGLVLAVYLVYPSNRNHWDGAIQNAIIVGAGRVDTASRHFLYTLIGTPYYRAWQAAGYTGDAVWPLQVLNAVCGAAGVAFLYLTLLRLTGRVSAAALPALLFAFSYGYWWFLADTNYNVLGFLGLTIAYWLLASLPMRPKAPSIVWGGIVALPVILAVCASLEHVIFVPVALAGFALLGTWPTRRSRLEAAASFLVVAVLGSALIYVLFAWTFAAVRSVPDFLEWLRSYSDKLPAQYMSLSLSRVPVAAKSLLLTLVQANGGFNLRELVQGEIDAVRLPSQAALAWLLLSSFAVGLWFAFGWRRIWQQRRNVLIFAFIWIAIYGVFAFWSDPFGPERWIPLLIPLATTLGLILSDVLSRPIRMPGALVFSSVAAFVALLTIGNLVASIRPDHLEPNTNLARARCVGAHLQDGDIIVSPAWDYTRYVGIATGKRAVSLMSIAGRTRSTSIHSEFEALLRATVAQGGRVYLVDIRDYDSNLWRSIRFNTGLTQADFASYRPAVAFTCEEQAILELHPKWQP